MRHVRYYEDRESRRAMYKICKTQEEYDDVWRDMDKSLIKGTFFQETLVHHGLIIFKVRTYKKEGKDEIGCAKCGKMWKKNDAISRECKRTDGSIYQLIYKCSDCDMELGDEWIQ